MAKVDSAGTYVGVISQSGFGTTQKNGYPQWVARLTVEKKYVEAKADLEHFKLEDPAWVDYSSFGEDIVAYMVLFKHATDLTPETVLLNYEQLKKATGWDGLSFETLASFVGKKILFRVEENSFNNTTSLQVSWIDAEDASPERQLRTLEPEAIKKLSGLIKMPAPKPAPAKAAGAAPKSAAAPAVATTAPTAAAPKTAAPKVPTKQVLKTPPPAPPVAEPALATSSLPAEITRDQAWEYICDNKGESADNLVEDCWIAATNELGDEAKYSPKDWAKVRDIVLKDLGLAK